MKFWDDLSPLVKKAVVVGAVVLGGLLVARYMVTAPTTEHSSQRGVK